jgi:small nuclear ribonucleoprotein (snRNP)-like protein
MLKQIFIGLLTVIDKTYNLSIFNAFNTDTDPIQIKSEHVNEP